LPDALLQLMQWVHKLQLHLRFLMHSSDYVLALKANHPTLHTQVKDWFEQHLREGFSGITHSYDQWVEKGHHRTEKRSYWCVPVSQLPPLHNQGDWAGLKCVVMVVLVRHLWNQTTREVQFYLTSLDCDASFLRPSYSPPLER